jgi:hypothetical protein
MKIKIILLGLLLSISTCWATSLQDGIQKLLAKPTTLRGQFVQVKAVQGFKSPMRSSGSFLLVPNKGLIWMTERPFTSEIRITRDKLVQKSEGTTTLMLDAKQQPALRVMNQVMFRLLSGDVHALDSDFLIKGTIDHAVWQITLHSKNPAVSKVLSQIVLTGGRYVAAISIAEANGDKTDIKLMAQKPSTLTAEESKRFE